MIDVYLQLNTYCPFRIRNYKSPAGPQVEKMLCRHFWLTNNLSQAARQGLAVLMATAVVVLKHETSTTYQSHIYESIDLKFG